MRMKKGIKTAKQFIIQETVSYSACCQVTQCGYKNLTKSQKAFTTRETCGIPVLKLDLS